MLQRFHNVLAQKGVNIKIKDFHACDNFFKTIVQAHIIALCMHHQGLTKINDLQTWLFRNDWANLISQFEGQYLNFEKVQNLCDGAKIDVLVDVATKLNTRKQKFKVE